MYYVYTGPSNSADEADNWTEASLEEGMFITSSCMHTYLLYDITLCMMFNIFSWLLGVNKSRAKLSKFMDNISHKFSFKNTPVIILLVLHRM